jgi:cytochrome c peroxidase
MAWRQGLSGFGQRVLSRAGGVAAQITLEHGLAAGLRHDLRYEPLRTGSRGGRAWHAVSSAVLARRTDRRRTLSLDTLVAVLGASPAYRAAFAAAFPDDPRVTPGHVARALATFQRTLVAPEAPFDRWVAGDTGAIAPAARRGFALFVGRARCATCHAGWAFTDGKFHDVGLPDGDQGRGAVTGRRGDAHAFRTPTLRDVGRRAPYMHDGSLPTLAAVARHYQHGVARRARGFGGVPRVALTATEEADLLAFLGTLDGPAAGAAVPTSGGG